jgi:thiamine pyrophosphate-dependent acetolactate synthase large subunit-like protein
MRCRFRRGEPDELERRVPGLASFGSAYGASIGASALCEVHDAWVSPGDGCSRFRARVD